MADMSFLAVNPINAPAAVPPPPPAAEPVEDAGIGKEGVDEKELIQQALAELDGSTGEEQPLEEKPKPKVEEKPKEEETQAKLSKGFAKLRAEEDRFDRRKAEENAKLQTMVADVEARMAKVKPLEEAMAKAGQSPLEALQLLGYSYKDLVDYVMADGKIPPEKFAERLSQQSKTEIEQVRAELEQLKQSRIQEQERYEAQQDMSRIEHQTRSLFADGAEGLQKFPTFAHHFKKSPEMAQKLLTDIQNLRARHFNETCTRDPKTGQIIKPGEIVDAVPAVAYIERILADMQISVGNPGQPGAVAQSANAGAARQQAPQPLTPRDLSVTSMPSDEELMKMSQEELDALADRIYRGG